MREYIHIRVVVLVMVLILKVAYSRKSYLCQNNSNDPHLCVTGSNWGWLRECKTHCCEGWAPDKYGHCSRRISSNYRMPQFTNCPRGGERVPVEIIRTGNVGYLHNFLLANDWEGQRLHVQLSKREFEHCKCSNIFELVTAKALDAYGNQAVCQFIVEVIDKYKPKFSNCPRDQTSYANAIVTWKAPSVHDNVGVKIFHAPDPSFNNSRLSPGSYNMTYYATDYSGNMGTCSFTIRVFRATHMGIHTYISSRQDSPLIIGGTIVAALFIILIVMALAMVRLCKKRRQLNNRLRVRLNQSGISSYNPQSVHDNPIFTVYNNDPPPYDIVASDKLPEYSPPTDPPPYEDVQDRNNCSGQTAGINRPFSNVECRSCSVQTGGSNATFSNEVCSDSDDIQSNESFSISQISVA